MRKLFFICLNFVWINAFAQDSKKQAKADNSKIQIGFSVGPSYTHVIYTPVYYRYHPELDKQSYFLSRRLSYSAAVHFQFNFNKTCALRTELFYEKKRAYRYGSANEVHFLDQYKITLPVFFKIYAQRFFTEAGVCLGYGFGEGYPSFYFEKDKKGPIKKLYDYYKNDNDFFSLGACLGLGYNVLSREKYSFSIGLRDDLEFNTEWPIYNARFNTINLLIGAAYKF